MSRQDFFMFPWCVCCLLNEKSRCIEWCVTFASWKLKHHACSDRLEACPNVKSLNPASNLARCGTIAPMWGALPYGHEFVPREKRVH